MATVTGYTAQRMKIIEDETVVDGLVVADDLILKRRDGVEINAGYVRGPKGDQGDQGTPGVDADPSFGGYQEPLGAIGNISGAINLDFSTHNAWWIHPIGAVTITFLNLPASGFVSPGTIIITNDDYPITWPVGTKFPHGIAPEIIGETYISVLALSTGVIVGAAWREVSV
jgi:hypothetical protein